MLVLRWSYPSPTLQLNFSAFGLLFLADLSTTQLRTALTGTSSYLDAFIIVPGFHRQQSAPTLNDGEYPAVGALTSGYVFRVENQATVVYLQKVGRTGVLTTLKVESWDDRGSMFRKGLSACFVSQNASLVSALAYLSAVCLAVVALLFLVLSGDYWGVIVLLILMFARLLNVCAIRSRARPSWHGQSEPGQMGDLLVLLSQDRWLRIKGPVDDLKAVTSGQWLRDQTFFESILSGFATFLVYSDAVLAANMTDTGILILFLLLITSAGLLAITNEYTTAFCMHGCTIQVQDRTERFGRRLGLVEALRQEKDRNVTGMESAFVQLGMVPAKQPPGAGKVTM